MSKTFSGTGNCSGHKLHGRETVEHFRVHKLKRVGPSAAITATRTTARFARFGGGVIVGIVFGVRALGIAFGVSRFGVAFSGTRFGAAFRTSSLIVTQRR